MLSPDRDHVLNRDVRLTIPISLEASTEIVQRVCGNSAFLTTSGVLLGNASGALNDVGRMTIYISVYRCIER